MKRIITFVLIIFISSLFLLSKKSFSPADHEKPLSEKHIESDDRSVSGDAFIFSSIADAVTLNPLLSSGSSSRDVWGNIFNSLVRYNPHFELEGELAESFEISHNSSIIYVHLNTDNDTNFDSKSLSDLLEKDKPASLTSMKPMKKFGSDFYSVLKTTWSDNPSEKNISLIKGLIPEGIFKKIDDQIVIHFHLRDDVRWQDGEIFDADDVIFTWQTIVNPDIQVTSRGYFTLIDQVEKIDQYHVKATYMEHFAPAVAAWTRSIVPEHLLADVDMESAEFNRSPIGTGPYEFVDWKPDERILLEANDKYFEGRPNIDNYIFTVTPDKSIQLVKLMNEEIDYMKLTPDQFEKFSATEEFKARFQLFNYPSQNGYSYMGFNHKKPLFSDYRVRQAITMAIDRQLIVDKVLRGHGHLISGPFPDASWACDENIKPLPYDVSAASILLDEAGWHEKDSDGIRFKNIEGQKVKASFILSTNNANETRRLTSLLIIENLKLVGIEARLELKEWSTFMKDIKAGLFDAMVLGWNLGMDPDQFGVWHSSQIPDIASGKPGQNYIGFANKTLDQLIEKGRTTMLRDQRLPVYHEMHALIHKYQPYTFLFASNKLLAVHHRFHGIELKPTGIWYDFNKWFVPLQLQKYKNSL